MCFVGFLYYISRLVGLSLNFICCGDFDIFKESISDDYMNHLKIIGSWDFYSSQCKNDLKLGVLMSCWEFVSCTFWVCSCKDVLMHVELIEYKIGTSVRINMMEYCCKVVSGRRLFLCNKMNLWWWVKIIYCREINGTKLIFMCIGCFTNSKRHYEIDPYIESCL